MCYRCLLVTDTCHNHEFTTTITRSHQPSPGLPYVDNWASTRSVVAGLTGPDHSGMEGLITDVELHRRSPLQPLSSHRDLDIEFVPDCAFLSAAFVSRHTESRRRSTTALDQLVARSARPECHKSIDARKTTKPGRSTPTTRRLREPG